MGLLLGEAVALALGVWLVAGHEQMASKGMAFGKDKGTNGDDTANPGNAGLANFDNPKIRPRHSPSLSIGKRLHTSRESGVGSKGCPHNVRNKR